MPIDTSKLSGMIADKKYDEMKSYLAEAIKEPMTSSQRGQELVNLSMLYIDVMTKVNNQYKELLQDAIGAYEKLKESEAKITDAIKLEQARAKLA